MDRETVDVIDNAGTDAGRQRGIAVGWKVGDIYVDNGCAGRALRERETANRRSGGRETKSPARETLGVVSPVFSAFDRCDMLVLPLPAEPGAL